MKKPLISILLSLFFMTVAMAKADNTIDMKSFSVSVPSGWIAEQSSANSVTLIMKDVPNEEVSITVSCSPMHSKISLDDAWNRIKSVTINKQSVISEDDDVFFNTKWKRIEIQQLVCNKDIRKIICFSIKDGNKWLIQFDSPKDDQKSNIGIFNRVKQSLKAK